MSASTLNILIIVFSGMISVLSVVLSKPEKANIKAPDPASAQSFGKTERVIHRCILWLSIIIIGLSVWFALQSKDENDTQFALNIAKFDTLLRKADTSFYKMDSSINLQRQLQDSTRKLDSLAAFQLYLTNAINSGNKELIRSSQRIMFNTDILTTPTLPMKVTIDMKLPFSIKHFDNFIAQIYKLKDDFEHIKKQGPGLIFWLNTSGKVDSLQIANPGEYFKTIPSGDLWVPVLFGGFLIKFIKTPSLTFEDFDKLNNPSQEIRFPLYKNDRSPNATSILKVNFVSKEINCKFFIPISGGTEYTLTTSYPALLINDLRDCFIYFRPFENSHGDAVNYIMRSIDLQLGNDYSRRIVLNTINDKTQVNYGFDAKCYIHKILNEEIR